MENEDAGAILAQASRDGFISPANRDMLAASLGPQGNAAFSSWMQDKGIKVQEQPVMDETELDTADDGSEDVGGLSVGDPSSFMREYQSSLAASAKAAQGEADVRRQLFEQAQRQLEQSQFGVPSTSERLFQISQALLSPSSMPGFRGSLNNVMPVLNQQATAQRTGAEQRRAALLKLQQDYASNTASGARTAADARVEALGKIAPSMLKAPRAKRTGFNPITGALVDMDTNEAVEAPAPVAGEIKVYKGRQYRFVGGDRYDQKNWQEVR